MWALALSVFVVAVVGTVVPLAAGNVWGFSPSDTTFIQSRYAVPGSAAASYGACSVAGAGNSDGQSNLGHWDEMLKSDRWGRETSIGRNTHSMVSDFRTFGVGSSHNFAVMDTYYVDKWRRYTGTNVDGLVAETGSVSAINAALEAAGASRVAMAATWKSHMWIYPSNRIPGRMPAALNHFARHVTSASSGKYFVSSGRPPTASHCFAVDIAAFAAATSVPPEAQPTVLAFRDQMKLAHAHGATVAWEWAAARFESRRQVRDAPHAIDAQLARQRAGEATSQQGYPAGGLPWSSRPYWAYDPQIQVDPVGRGGAAYEYGPVAWDAPAGKLIYRVYEYADGDVTVGNIADLDGFISEAASFIDITFDDAVAMDGGVLKDTLFPQPVSPVTIYDVREYIGKTEVKWSWKKFKMVKVYDHDLIDETVERINDRAANYNTRTAEMYGTQYSTVLSARYPWGVIETCRSDAPGMSCEAAAGGSSVHDAVFDITCIAPRDTFKVARCEANRTVAAAIRSTIYDRSAREYNFGDRIVEEPSSTYSRICHNAHSVCYRGVKAGGHGFTSITCGRRKALGEPCGPVIPTGRGGSTLQTRHAVPAPSGWVDIRTGVPYCYLGKGGPECTKSCGDLYGADMHGRRREFPHARCTAVDWSSCAGNPADGVNCTMNSDCTVSGQSSSGSAEKAYRPRNQGCNRHGTCFTPEDPGRCVCGANVQGRFCDACADGYYGYNTSIRPIVNTYSADRCVALGENLPAYLRRYYARNPSARPDACDVDGPLARTPLSEAVRGNATLLDPAFLYAGTAVDGGGGGGGGRRLVEEDELTPAQAAAITDSGSDMEWLYTQPGRGAILRPPVVNALGCAGSCWGWRPEDGVTDDLTFHGTATYGWNPSGSSGRYSLRDSCGVAVVASVAQDGELVAGPAYAGAVESFTELSARCNLDSASSGDVFLSRARVCRATPNGTDIRVLQSVCNFEETFCTPTTLGDALEAAGHTPHSVLGCPSSWTPSVATSPHATQWPVPGAAPACTGDAMGSAVASARDAASTGGWHTVQVHCENVNTECVLRGEAYGGMEVDPDTGLSTGRQDVRVDSNGDRIYATSPCDSCGPMHVNEVLRSQAPEVEGVGAWAACPALCDPAVWFAHAASATNGVWESGANAGRRRGITPSHWLGCPTVSTTLSPLATVVDADADGPNSTASLSLDDVLALVPPRWVSDWRQCLPEHFYGDAGEASRLHVGDPHGYTSSSTPSVSAEMPSDWLPAFAELWPVNTTVFRVSAPLHPDSGTTCTWVEASDDNATAALTGAARWNCTYTVRLCSLTGEEGPVCGYVPRPLWQELNGITPQSVLGCSSLWGDIAPRARLLVASQTPYARSDPDGHVCNPAVFAGLNTADIVAAPTEADYATVASFFPAVAAPGIGLDIRVASLGNVSLPVLPVLSPASSPAYSCVPRESTFAARPIVRDNSTVILGHICGGPSRAATCSVFDPECASKYPACSPGSPLACRCHDKRGCDACRPGSNLDPSRNCVECLPRHTWVENGAFDTCEFVDGCYAPGHEGDEHACGGRGTCVVSATRPPSEEPSERQRIVYADMPPSDISPFQATNGYSGVKTRCVCGLDASGPFCSLNTTSCWAAGHVGAGGPSSASGVRDLGYSGALAPNMTTIDDSRFLGGQRPVGAVACRGGMQPELSQPGGCDPNAFVIQADIYTSWYEWLLVGDNFDMSDFRVEKFDKRRISTTDNTFRDRYLWLYQVPADHRPPGFSYNWRATFECSAIGGRDMTAEEFMKAPLWKRRVYSRFYDWSGGYLAKLAARGHNMTYRNSWKECIRMPSSRRPGSTSRTYAPPIDADAQLSLTLDQGSWRQCTSFLPPACVVDTCSTNLRWSTVLT